MKGNPRWQPVSRKTMFRILIPLQKAYKNNSSALLYLLLLGALLVLTVVSVRDWLPTVFFGDDLANLLAFKNGEFASSLVQAISSAYADKYRPVFAVLMWMVFNLFGKNIDGYLAFNVILHTFNAFLVFVIAKKISRGELLFSILAACATAVSRFSLYQVTQVTGLLEGTALTFFLMTLYCIVQGSVTKQLTWKWKLGAIIFSLLALHTHERYVVLTVWLSMIFLIMPPGQAYFHVRRLLLAVVAIGLLLINFSYKVLVLHMPFFVGTGGKSLGLDYQRIFVSLQQALLSVFGFNTGPEYLVGRGIVELGLLSLILAAMFTLVWMITVLWSCRNIYAYQTENTSLIQSFFWPIAISSVGIALLVPPILTIRLEQRWLLEPFILVLLGAAWAIGALRERLERNGIILTISILLGILPIIIDLRIAPYYKNIFFVYSGKMATSVKEGESSNLISANGPLYFLAGNDLCNWILQNGQFFYLYGDVRREVSCIPDKRALLKSGFPRKNLYTFSNEWPLRLLDITSEQQSLPNTAKEIMSSDLLEMFGKGEISSNAYVDSPTGKGVLRLNWNSVLGERKILVVISGFSYKYRGILVEPKAELNFGISMLYPGHSRAHAFVRIIDAKLGDVLIYSADIAPLKPGAMADFRAVSLPLKQFIGRKVTVEIGVTTPSGEGSNGHWVGFSDLRIIKPL